MGASTPKSACLPPSSRYTALFAAFRSLLAAAQQVGTALSILQVLPQLPGGIIGYRCHWLESVGQRPRTPTMLVNSLLTPVQVPWTPGDYQLELVRRNEADYRLAPEQLRLGSGLTLAAQEALLLR